MIKFFFFFELLIFNLIFINFLQDIFKRATELNSGVGMRLLQKMGWQPGEGLGKDKAGSIEPLSIDIKSDRRGFVKFNCFYYYLFYYFFQD